MALARTSSVWGGSSSISRDFKIRSSVTGNAVKEFSSRKQGLERDLVPLNDRLRSLSVLQLLVYRSKTLRRRRLRCSGTSRRYRFGKSFTALRYGAIRLSSLPSVTSRRRFQIIEKPLLYCDSVFWRRLAEVRINLLVEIDGDRRSH